MTKSGSRIVAIDYGEQRIGLAISDENKRMALPWTTTTGGLMPLLSTLRSRLSEIERFVIGLPLLMNGTKGSMAKIVEQFGKELELQLGLPVTFLDERLTSKEADLSLKALGQNRRKRAKKIDETAATLLLRSYLFSQESH